jgi:hypothetical protein
MSFGMRPTPAFARSARRVAALCALVLVAGCMSAPDDTGSGVEGTLKLNFSSWQPVATKDVLPAMRDPWLSGHPKQDRMIITGDYFGAGSSAYAALLTKKDKQGRRVRLVVLKPTDGGRFETYILQTESPMDTMPVITTSTKNEYEVVVGGQSLVVPVEGVVYQRPDGRQKLFFWNVDRFTDIELGPASPAPPDTSGPPS